MHQKTLSLSWRKIFQKGSCHLLCKVICRNSCNALHGVLPLLASSHHPHKYMKAMTAAKIDAMQTAASVFLESLLVSPITPKKLMTIIKINAILRAIIILFTPPSPSDQSNGCLTAFVIAIDIIFLSIQGAFLSSLYGHRKLSSLTIAFFFRYAFFATANDSYPW